MRRTVISFLVSVPVLSEQTVVTEPSASTAGSLRVIALRRAICCTPIASVIVTSAGQALGDRRHREADRRRDELGERHPVQEAPDREHEHGHAEDDEGELLAEVVELLRERRRQGSGLAHELWILPISVAAPVAVTMPRPCPAETIVPENAIDARSPTPASAATGSESFDDGTDSPGQRRLVDAQLERLEQAHIGGHLVAGREPDDVAGHEVGRGTVAHPPSRRTLASADSIPRMPASAVSARPSWTKPITALMTATAMMTQKSSQSPMIALMAPAPSRM